MLLVPTVVKSQSLADLAKSFGSVVTHVVTLDTLRQRDGLIYQKFTDTPFTGNTMGQYQFKIVNGKFTGALKVFDEDGQLECKGSLTLNFVKEYLERRNPFKPHIQDIKITKACNLRVGQQLKEREGFWSFYSLGNLYLAGEYKAGLKHGSWKFYKESGELDFSVTYKDGKKISD